MSYRPEILVRVCLAGAGFAGILFAPWWVVAVCMVLLSLRYAAWEVPLMGLCMDLVWFPWDGRVALPFFALFGVFIVWVTIPLRRQLFL